MATTANRQADYITEARDAARRLWRAWEDLLALQPEWNAQDYGNTLTNGTGDNLGINKAAVGAVVFDTANAIQTEVMAAGHATNVSNLL